MQGPVVSPLLGPHSTQVPEVFRASPAPTLLGLVRYHTRMGRRDLKGGSARSQSSSSSTISVSTLSSTRVLIAHSRSSSGRMRMI